MESRPRDERDEIIRQLSTRERELSAENSGLDKAMERADRIIGLVKWLLGGLAAILLWAARLQWTVAEQGETITRNGTRITFLEGHVADLWFMKEHGINNTFPKP